MGKQKSKKAGLTAKRGDGKIFRKSAAKVRFTEVVVGKTKWNKKTKSTSSSTLVHRPDRKPPKDGSEANIGPQSPPKPKPTKPSEKEGEQK